MAASLIFRAADGMTIPDLIKKTAANVAKAGEGGISAAAVWSRKIVAAEGQPHYVRARRTRKPVHLNAALRPQGKNQVAVQGVPPGFWAIINEGSTPGKEWRIERKKGRGRNRRTVGMLSTPYGPRPYVIRKSLRPSGRPWAAAMMQVDRMPQTVVDPSIVSAFAEIWK
jgi:hypothetical protein